MYNFKSNAIKDAFKGRITFSTQFRKNRKRFGNSISLQPGPRALVQERGTGGNPMPRQPWAGAAREYCYQTFLNF